MLMSPAINLVINWQKNIGLHGNKCRLFENFGKEEELITIKVPTSASENFFPQMAIFKVQE
jgi:hypothetical protein